MEFKIADQADWPGLFNFYSRIYRPNHPLQFQDFWEWQYGDENFGRAFVVFNDEGNIVGHVGANFGGGYAWIINVYLDELYRGKGILSKLYSAARNFYPLAATSANTAGLGLYRNMQWYRYANLERFVLINPSFQKLETDELVSEIELEHSIKKPEGHYWDQPQTIAHVFSDGSKGVLELKNGGIRAVEINDCKNFADEAFALNYRWIDYISSWNDSKLRTLEQSGWVRDFQSKIPWRLNPIIKNSAAEVSYLSELPMPKNFTVLRSFSDHGRIGSIKINN